jgi:hypothetical protein
MPRKSFVSAFPRFRYLRVNLPLRWPSRLTDMQTPLRYRQRQQRWWASADTSFDTCKLFPELSVCDYFADLLPSLLLGAFPICSAHGRFLLSQPQKHTAAKHTIENNRNVVLSLTIFPRKHAKRMVLLGKSQTTLDCWRPIALWLAYRSVSASAAPVDPLAPICTECHPESQRIELSHEAA